MKKLLYAFSVLLTSILMLVCFTHAMLFITGPQDGSYYASNAKTERWIVKEVGVCVPRRQGTCSYVIELNGQTLFLESQNAYHKGQSVFRNSWTGPLGGEYKRWSKQPIWNTGGPGLWPF